MCIEEFLTIFNSPSNYAYLKALLFLSILSNFQKKIPKNLSIGIMINASDFLNNPLSLDSLCKDTFPKLKQSKIKFVRIACHYKEIFEIEPIINWLKKRKIFVTVNLMQISELNKKPSPEIKIFLSSVIFGLPLVTVQCSDL